MAGRRGLVVALALLLTAAAIAWALIAGPWSETDPDPLAELPEQPLALVAELESRVLGFGHLWVYRDLDTGEDTLHLWLAEPHPGSEERARAIIGARLADQYDPDELVLHEGKLPLVQLARWRELVSNAWEPLGLNSLGWDQTGTYIQLGVWDVDDSVHQLLRELGVPERSIEVEQSRVRSLLPPQRWPGTEMLVVMLLVLAGTGALFWRWHARRRGPPPDPAAVVGGPSDPADHAPT